MVKENKNKDQNGVDIKDKLVATHSTNIPDDENLAIAAMSLSGSASGTRVTTIDYLMGARTR